MQSKAADPPLMAESSAILNDKYFHLFFQEIWDATLRMDFES
jgi:hypothetical protein